MKITLDKYWTICVSILTILLLSLFVICMPVAAAADEYYIYSTYDPAGVGIINSAGGYVEYQGIPDVWGDEIQYVYFLSGRTGYKVRVKTIDGDGDGKIDPRQHPNHYISEYQGSIEPRQFEIVSSKYLGGYASGHTEEFHIDSSGVYLGAYPNGINKWDHNWNYIGKIANSPPRTETLAYNPGENVWYAGGRYRTVYELSDSDNDGSFLDETWKGIFTHPSYGGGHHDGMEYVGGYLWISDMTSDVIAKWWYNPTSLVWEELDSYSYTESAAVEGMGFGPNDHFWVSGSTSYIYELGNEITKGYPIANAGEDIDNYPPILPAILDASSSRHTDPTKQIVLYEWDFESDGIWDYSGTDLLVPHEYPASYNPDGSINWDETAKDYVATLRVTDNRDPPLKNMDTSIVHITAAPWKPVVNTGGPYEGSVGVHVRLDGSMSFDPEEKYLLPGHPWYETLAKYEWDLDYDGEFDDSTDPNPTWIWNTEGPHIVGLRVTDSDPSGPGGTYGPMDVNEAYATVVINEQGVCSDLGINNNGLKSKDPINMGNGNYIYQHQDLIIPGRGLPFTITRSYNSMDVYNGPFGSGWTFNYNMNLEVTGSGDVVVMKEDGRRDTYTLNADGTYSPPLSVFDNLTKNQDNTYTLGVKGKIEYNFTPLGKLVNITDQNGNQISLTYTGDNLTKVADASGRELIFSYDASGRIISITDPMGRIWSYAYDAMDNLVQYSDPTGGQFSYVYDENHWMTSIIDPRGDQIMANIFDAEGRVVSQSNALGGTFTYSYDVGNQETTETDPFGGTIIYAFDEHFWGLSQTDQLGNTISYTYDENGNRISVTNGNGQTTQFAYDANGNIIQITNPLGDTTFMSYDSKDNLISLIDALGNQVLLEYDSNSNLIRTINALGDETVFTYDEYGQIISGTDAMGNTANFVHDMNGNQISVTDAMGNIAFFNFDIVSRLISMTDANGNMNVLTFDDLDRLISVTDPLGNTASNIYDAVGNRIVFIDAVGSSTSYSYNPLNDLVEVTDAMGGTVQYSSDVVGNMISITDANGYTTNFAYDPLNRPISIIDPLGHTTSNTYDAIGNMISLTDAEGSLTTYSYDQLNQLVEVIDAMGGTVQYNYDAVGNMISMTDANGQTTNYAYDPLSRPTSVIDPLSHTTSSTYDAVGNVVGLTDANGNLISYNYDALNRLAEIAYDDGQMVSYGYDATGNRLMMVDSHGTTNYQYDDLNRLINVINPDSQIVGYVYDAVSNRIQLTYPDGKAMTYGYDANNRLTGATDWDGHITGYSYDVNSNLIGLTYPNGMSTEYLYDENNQLIELINEDTTQVVSSFEYTLDAVGNRQSVAEWFSERYDDESGISQVLTTSYEYDDLYRLTQVNYPFEETVNYNYDPMGNRISMITTIDETDKIINYVYDASDRLLQSGGTTYDYDNNGNMVRKTENPGQITSYNYDGTNQLISLSRIFDGSQREIYNFEYDGDGNRLSKTTINGKRTKSSDYLLDVNTNLPQVLTESDDKGTTFYAHGLDLISMTDPRGKGFYYHYDGLGSVRSMSDSKESIKTIYSYDAFGQTRKEMGHVDNDFRFTGEQMDDEAGLIYLRARYYDPGTGRFINKDPFMGIGTMTQSINRYVYTMNNPVNLIDPMGLWAYSFGLSIPVPDVKALIEDSIDDLSQMRIWDETPFEKEYYWKTFGIEGGISDENLFLTTKWGYGGEFDLGPAYSPDAPKSGSQKINEICAIYCSGGDVKLGIGAFSGESYTWTFDHPVDDAGVVYRAADRKLISLWEDAARAADKQLTPPWKDIGVLGRATKRWLIPEAK